MATLKRRARLRSGIKKTSRMKMIVVVPTYNESQNIVELVSTIRAECRNFDLDILVVDSASPDRTADRVRELQKKDARLFLFEQPAKLGLGRAYMDGMDWVLKRDYEVLVTMDADMSHHPKYLVPMIEAIQGHDLVVGSRYVKGGGLENWPIVRQCLSRFANWYASTLTGLPFHDLTSGFQCFRTTLLRKVLSHIIHTEGYAFQVELKFLSMTHAVRFKEMPIIFTDRMRGSSKISRRVVLESVFFVLRCFFKRHLVRQGLSDRQPSSSFLLD